MQLEKEELCSLSGCLPSSHPVRRPAPSLSVTQSAIQGSSLMAEIGPHSALPLQSHYCRHQFPSSLLSFFFLRWAAVLYSLWHSAAFQGSLLLNGVSLARPLPEAARPQLRGWRTPCKWLLRRQRGNQGQFHPIYAGKLTFCSEGGSNSLFSWLGNVAERHPRSLLPTSAAQRFSA